MRKGEESPAGSGSFCCVSNVIAISAVSSCRRFKIDFYFGRFMRRLKCCSEKGYGSGDKWTTLPVNHTRVASPIQGVLLSNNTHTHWDKQLTCISGLLESAFFLASADGTSDLRHFIKTALAFCLHPLKCSGHFIR